MSSQARLFILLVVLAVAVGSWLWSDRPTPPPAAAIANLGDREIDYRISGFDVTRMKPTGEPANRLRAELLEHFSDDDTSVLTGPRLIVYGDGDVPPWQIDAATAQVPPDGDIVDLRGEVLIVREAHAQRPPMRIETRDLRVRPDDDFAETRERVRVHSGDDWIDAVGMEAWLRPPSRIKFLSQVRGSYAPL
jgi:lipopolysaccharide export system protein LptC